MDSSPFKKFPREIRDRVYTLIIAQSEPVGLRIGNVSTAAGAKLYIASNGDASLGKTLTGLPSTCKQARIEAGPIVFANNRFEFTAKSLTDEEGDMDIQKVKCMGGLGGFADQIGKKNAALIQCVNVKFGCWYLDGLENRMVRAIGKVLTDVKRGLHRNAVLTAQITFDLTDFEPIPNHTENLTADICIPVGNTKEAQKVLRAVIDGSVASYKAGLDEPDPVAEAKCARTYDQFRGVIWTVLRTIFTE